MHEVRTISAVVLILKPPVFVISGGVFVPFIIPIDSSIQFRLENGHQPLGNLGSRMIYSHLASRI